MVNIFAGPNSKYKLPGSKPAGFWAGLWHGVIVPIAIVESISTDSQRIYETKNNGFAYNIGFVIAICAPIACCLHNPGKLILLQW